MKWLSSWMTCPGKALSPRLPDGKARQAGVSSGSPTPGMWLPLRHPPGRRGTCAGRGTDTWGSGCRRLWMRNASSSGQDDLLSFASTRWHKNGSKLPCGEAKAGAEEPLLPQDEGGCPKGSAPGLRRALPSSLLGFPSTLRKR